MYQSNNPSQVVENKIDSRHKHSFDNIESLSSETHMSVLLPILVLGVTVILFGMLIVWGTAKAGPKPKQSDMKLDSYECGLESQQTGHSKVPVKFYLTAILFILFDIEIIFMYPWAIYYGDAIAEGVGLQIMLSMVVFLLIFIVGLFWEVKSKALEWD